MPEESGSWLGFKGFGLEGSAHGPLVFVVVLVLILMAWIWRAEVAIRNEIVATARSQQDAAQAMAKARADATTAMLALVREDHEHMVALLERITCAVWYTPEERRAIRSRIEKDPDLKVWCP